MPSKQKHGSVSLNPDGDKCQETKQQEGHENKRNKKCNAPMGAIA